jgi:Tol biopolymer transport system component
LGDSGDIHLSADGKWAVFASTGNGLVTNTTERLTLNIFLRNNETGEISLISKPPAASGEIAANGNSYAPRISADGSFVLFETEAGNLFAPEDEEDEEDEGTYAMLFSRLPGTSEGTLAGPLGQDFHEMNGAASGTPTFSPDGRFLLFETDAPISILDTNNSVDLYLISTNAQAQLVTTSSNSLTAANVSFPSSILGNFEASMSADGRFVAFVSPGLNHAPGLPANSAAQLYLRDMEAQTNAWLSRSTLFPGAATLVSSPRVSTNGEWVLFLSSALQTISPPPGASDTFLYSYHIPTGLRTRIGGTPTIHSVSEFALSDNGQFVALSSSNQVYLHHLATGTNFLVSRTPSGEPASGLSSEPAVSADGRIVIFTSNATNLVEGTAGEVFQLYRFDRDSGEVALLSRSAADASAGADSDVIFPVLSADGSTAAFMSYASNLSTNDNPLSNDLFLVSSSGTGAVTLASAPHPLSLSSTPAGPSFVEAQAISLDGQVVVFSSEAPDLADDSSSTRRIYVRELSTGTTSLVSRQNDGTPLPGHSSFLGASLDLRTILFSTTEISSTGGSVTQLYAYDTATHSNALASILPNGETAATVSKAIISPDGRLLAFRELTASSSPLYSRDLAAGVTTRYSPISVGTEPLSFSPSGRFLITRHLSTSYAFHDLTIPAHLTNITSYHYIPQPFSANDLLLISVGSSVASELQLRSLATTNPPIAIRPNATPVAISLDGSSVAYTERDGTNSFLFVYDVHTGESSPLMLHGTNLPVRLRPGAAFSANGRYIAFISADSLTQVGHPFNKLYVYDTVLETLQLAAVNDADEPAEFGVGNLSISANGRVIAFDTLSANLVPNDLNLSSDVFVVRLATVDSDSDGLEDGWEQIFFEGLDISGDTDSDGDGISNLAEFQAGTDPENASSNLSLQMESSSEVFSITVPASPGVSYQLEYCTDLSTGAWHPFTLPVIALHNSITFHAPLELEGQIFFRISAAH